MTRWLARGGAIAMVLAIAGSGVASAESVAAWFPLEPGSKREYTTHRDRVLDRPDAPADRQFRHGRAVANVLAGEAGRVELQLVRRRHDARLADPRETAEHETQIYAASRDGLRLHGTIHGDPEPRRIDYEPALTVLRAPLSSGRRWKVGLLRQGGLVIDVEARVIGQESIAIGSREHADALRLRFSGSVRGAVETAEGVLEVRDGRYVQDWWLGRGIGTLREVVTIEIEAENGEGETLRLSDVATRTLREPAAP